MKIAIHGFTTSMVTPFVSQKGMTEAVRHVVVSIEYRGFCGIGVARADEKLELNAMLLAVAKLTSQFDMDDIAVARRQIEAQIGRNALSVAMDVALHDLVGRKKNLPVHALAGRKFIDGFRTAISIGAKSDAEILDAVRAVVHWPILKIKLTADRDVDIINKIRSIYRGEIWVDANGAWSLDQATENLDHLQRARVALVEQPLPRGHIGALRQLREKCAVKLAADEDVTGVNSIREVCGSVDIVNVKLHACGGVSGAIETMEAARAAGLGVMIGCRTESVAGVTAAAHLAPLSDYADLDGHLDIFDDPFAGATVDRGWVSLPTGAGIGAVRRAQSKIILEEL